MVLKDSSFSIPSGFLLEKEKNGKKWGNIECIEIIISEEEMLKKLSLVYTHCYWE